MMRHWEEWVRGVQVVWFPRIAKTVNERAEDLFGALW